MTEPYTITPSDNGREALLIIRQDQEMRAWNLARALHGRWAPGVRGFFLTPARADKWKVLFAAGFDAVTIRYHDQRIWAFIKAGSPRLTLSEAMQQAAPNAIEEMEVEF